MPLWAKYSTKISFTREFCDSPVVPVLCFAIGWVVCVTSIVIGYSHFLCNIYARHSVIGYISVMNVPSNLIGQFVMKMGHMTDQTTCYWLICGHWLIGCFSVICQLIPRRKWCKFFMLNMHHKLAVVLQIVIKTGMLFLYIVWTIKEFRCTVNKHNVYTIYVHVIMIYVCICIMDDSEFI